MDRVLERLICDMPMRTTAITLPESMTGQVRTLTGYGPAPFVVSKVAMPLRAASLAWGSESGACASLDSFLRSALGSSHSK